MLLAMRRLQKVPNETKLQRIVEVLDDDHDGNININLALKVSLIDFSALSHWLGLLWQFAFPLSVKQALSTSIHFVDFNLYSVDGSM